MHKAEASAKKKGTKKPDKPKLFEWNLTMTKMDCRQLSKNFAFMARTLCFKKSDEEMLDAGKAVLEHHFDNHEHCGNWCCHKHNMDDNTKFYHDKVKDAALYAKLQSIIARFVTLEALKEVGHTMDTCANESFNNMISWLAPKNKVYARTNSLKNQICIAIGIFSLGTKAYYEGLFHNLGITITPDVLHYLTVKDWQ